MYTSIDTRAIIVKDRKQSEITYCWSMMEKTTDCAMTKQFGSTCPSSPQIFAGKSKKKKEKSYIYTISTETLIKNCLSPFQLIKDSHFEDMQHKNALKLK